MGESKQLKKHWFDFYKSKALIPVPSEGPDLPTKSDRTTPYCLTVEHAGNIILPPQLTKDIEDEFSIIHRFNLTIYHPPSKRFFGSTFVGGAFYPSFVEKDKPEAGKTIHSVEFNQRVFFHTTIIDHKCVALLELVAVVLVDEVEVREAGVGWTFIHLFSDTEHTDILDDTTAPELVVSQIFSGSPRNALFAPGDVLEGKGFVVVPNCEVTHTLQTHQTLRCAVHLLRENEMVGEWDVIPGIIRVPVEGVQAREEDFSPYFPVPELKTALIHPEVSPSISLFVGNLRVVVPRPVEDGLMKSLNANRYLEYDVQPDAKEASILERRVTLGAHNGRGFTGPLSRHVLHAEQHVTGGEVGAWRFQGSVAFAGVAAHPCFALLLQLEYLVRVPLNPHHKSETKVPTSVDIVIPIGWTVHVPFNGEDFLTGHMALGLKQGPDASPISNSFVFASPDVKVRIVLECVIHTESSADRTKTPEPSVSAPQFISSANFRTLRGLPPPAPSPVRASLRSLRNSSHDIRAPSPPPPPPQQKQLQQPEQTPPKKEKKAEKKPPPRERTPDPTPTPSPPSTPPRSPSPSPSPSPPPTPSPPPSVQKSRPRSVPQQVKQRAVMPLARLDPSSDGDEEGGVPLPTPKMNLAPVVNAAAAQPQKHLISRARKAKVFESAMDFVDSAGAKSLFPMKPDVPKPRQEEVPEASEILIQFLAFSRIPDQLTKFTVPQSLRTLFFTLQFYRFSPHVTERLFLQEGEEPRMLVQGDTQKGLQVRYLAEGPSFHSYLAERILAIDVWDGESLLYLGTANVELRSVLRTHGERSAQVTEEYDIIYKEHTPSDETRGGANMMGDYAGDANARGRLHLRMTNTRKDLLGLDPTQTKPVVLLEQQKPLPHSGSSKVVVRRLAETDKDLDVALKQRKFSEPFVPSVLSNDQQQAALAETQQRKRTRLERYRRTINKQHTTRPGTVQERQADLRTIQLYRDRSKREVITRKLRLYTTTTHTIYPSCGASCFFEFAFRNPYAKEHCFQIEFDDPDLKLITNPDEWRCYKKIHNIVTPMEEDMFDGNKLWMHANEVLTIPFKFLSFQSGSVGTAEGSPSFLSQPPPDEPIRARSISVVIAVDGNHQPNTKRVICVLEIRVVPQPFIVDRTFRFYHSENDFLKKVVALEHKKGQPRKYIKCSNSNVIVGYNAQNDDRDPTSLLIKARCGASPSVSRFCLQLFHDPFMASLAETWQVYIHALQRLDVSGVLGQTTKATLVLRGSQSSRLVQCFSSHPSTLRLSPDYSFTLVAGALNEVAMTFMPSTVGKQEVCVHVVDIEFHQLISAYLIQTNSTNPAITKTFEISLPANKGSNKKISYTNPYSFRKSFLLRTNRPNLIQFKEPKIEVNPKERIFISVRFLPNAYVHGRAEIFIFINGMAR